jgi:hypothetical protein
MPLGRSRVRNTKNGGQNSSGMSIWNRIGDDNNFQRKSNHVLTVSSYMEGVVRRLCHRQDAADWCNRPCRNHTLRSAAELCHDTASATRVPVEHIPEHRKPALEWRRDGWIRDSIIWIYLKVASLQVKAIVLRSPEIGFLSGFAHR